MGTSILNEYVCFSNLHIQFTDLIYNLANRLCDVDCRFDISCEFIL